MARERVDILAAIRKLPALALLGAMLGQSTFADPPSPPAQAFLASYLVQRDRPPADRLREFKTFLRLIEKNLRGEPSIYVRSLADYRQLRHPSFDTPGEAWAHFAKAGMITPFNVRARDEVKSAILEYEVSEAEAMIKLVDRCAPGALTGPLEACRMLPQLFRAGQTLHDFVDETSGRMADGLLTSGGEAMGSGAQLGGFGGLLSAGWGAFELFAGAGVSVLRFAGQQVVNPYLRRQMTEGRGLDLVRAQAQSEIRALATLGDAAQLALINKIDRLLDRTLLREGRAAIGAQAMALPSGLQKVIEQSLLPKLLELAPRPQVDQVLWTAINTPDFLDLNRAQQLQIVFEHLGPLLSQVMHMLGNSDVPGLESLSQLTCCKPVTEAAAEVIAPKLKESPWVMDEASEPESLARRPLKESWRVILLGVRDREATEAVVQTTSEAARSRLAADLKLVHDLSKQNELNDELRAVGLPHFGEVLQVLEAMVREELDFGRTAHFQKLAARHWSDRPTIKAGIRVELRVPKVLWSSEDILVQEFAPGVSLLEARQLNPRATDAALEVFGERYLESYLAPEGLVWAEPSARNLRFDFSTDGQSVRVAIFNFGSTSVIDREVIKGLAREVNPRSIPAMLDALHRGATDAKTLLELNQLTGQLSLDVPRLRMAQGLMQLQRLLGTKRFRALLVRFVATHPGRALSLLKDVLGAQIARLGQALECERDLNSGSPRK